MPALILHADRLRSGGIVSFLIERYPLSMIGFLEICRLVFIVGNGLRAKNPLAISGMAGECKDCFIQ